MRLTQSGLGLSNFDLGKRGFTKFSPDPTLFLLWGPLYRSTGQNINGPNINELQINCSKGQQKPVDV